MLVRIAYAEPIYSRKRTQVRLDSEGRLFRATTEEARRFVFEVPAKGATQIDLEMLDEDFYGQPNLRMYRLGRCSVTEGFLNVHGVSSSLQFYQRIKVS